MEFLPQVKTFQNYYWTYIPSLETFLSSVEFFIRLFSLSFISFKNDFSQALESLLHYNPLINLFKNPTKIWRCHVMFLNHFYAKMSSVHWRFLALHQVFKSGPVGNFALQPI